MASNPEKVAVIGTGLAGLTTAHLLHSDREKRYAVTLLDQSPRLSFDSSSVTIRNEESGDVERVDLPMRASAGGYYAQLSRMYEYLNIRIHPVKFFFIFARALKNLSSSKIAKSTLGDDSSAKDGVGNVPGAYFVHASNLHQTPPPWPANRSVIGHLFEILFLVVCQFWFSVACFFIAPGDDSLGQYLSRIRLPRRYAAQYLLPLMSSVSTCSHDEMLDFPASDVVSYKKLSHGQQHYAVCGGVTQVQEKLVEGLQDIRLGRRVTRVETQGDGKVKVIWQVLEGHASVGEEEETFDKVVLAVSPDIAAFIFSPLRWTLGSIPTVQVESSVCASPSAKERGYSVVQVHEGSSNGASCMHHRRDGSMAPAQVITFRTDSATSAGTGRTEALHTMPSGVVVKTCPLEDDHGEEKQLNQQETLQVAKFTRTLRSVQSRRLVEQMLGRAGSSAEAEKTGGNSGWYSGKDNVYVSGAWCWDGMVLLEGCVVSAMAVARDLGVRVPWEG